MVTSYQIKMLTTIKDQKGSDWALKQWYFLGSKFFFICTLFFVSCQNVGHGCILFCKIKEIFLAEFKCNGTYKLGEKILRP